MHSIEYNLALLKEMMADFEAHILSQELFWPLRKKSFDRVPFPQLSIGALLLTLDELEAQAPEMNALDERTYHEQLHNYERISQKFQVAIETKAAREEITRTNLWRAYLQDLEDDPEAIDEYSRQVRNRVLMTKLRHLSGVDQVEAKNEEGHGLDEWMTLDSVSAKFLWDERLEQIYPIEEFPFLYKRPR